MKLSIFTTTYMAEEREELYAEAMRCFEDLADEVIEVNDKWPDEFEWPLIGEMFQRGYERCSGEYVIHADLDYIFHERDHQKIRDLMRSGDNFNFYKYQIYTPDKYTLKSRIPIMVNKARYGDRIKFNGGADLTFPSLDGVGLTWQNTIEAKIPIYNYDALIKTKANQAHDRARFARAYHRHFGEWKHGREMPHEALEDWLYMVKGRYTKHQPFKETHPKYMSERIKNLVPQQFGFNGWGEL